MKTPKARKRKRAAAVRSSDLVGLLECVADCTPGKTIIINVFHPDNATDETRFDSELKLNLDTLIKAGVHAWGEDEDAEAFVRSLQRMTSFAKQQLKRWKRSGVWIRDDLPWQATHQPNE